MDAVMNFFARPIAFSSDKPEARLAVIAAE
jgi:hypothetical protein